MVEKTEYERIDEEDRGSTDIRTYIEIHLDKNPPTELRIKPIKESKNIVFLKRIVLVIED
jgi:hypothetical protein